MAEITAAAVKALREKTDLPMMECKKALTEAGGDEQKAIAILKEMFKKVQEKRADNVTAEGRIFMAIRPDASEAALVEIQCESAPVATGEVLQKFGQAMVDQLLAGPGAADPAALMSQKAAGAAQTFQEQYEEIVNKIREKIVVNRVLRVSGVVGGYVHHDFKMGVLFVAAGTPKNDSILRDVAMHIAALNPLVTFPEQLDPALVATERDRLRNEALASGKKENMVDKIVEGQLKRWFGEQHVLVMQPFAKDDKKIVGDALAEGGVQAVSYVRWKVGG
ncbi:MAG TPA: translation elongation factor Ts [Planctomycetaceae bacterium]|nr:translation elongation factor Ts [Planctomycetaceae bacterium]HBC62436.1 translation elongation factor Ts [Planctomycetaceae bacterium]